MNRWWFALYLILFPILAFAETDSMTLAPPPTDNSVIFLENIFGVVDGVLHGTGSQMVGTIFKVFNSGILVLGGIIVMYIIIVSTMMTAQEGQMLGQKWSSIWIPLRATIGLSLLIPKASGYCAMQIFVMWVTVQGVGLGDKIWAEALNYMNKGGVIISANMSGSAILTSDSSQIADGAAKILYGQVCMVGLETQLEAQRESYLASKEQGSGPCAGTPSSTMQAFCDTPVPNFLGSVSAVEQYNLSSPDAKDYSVNMPNFDSGSIYSGLNGICGKIVWNNLMDEATTESLSEVESLSESDMDSIASSRAVAIDQMYSTLSSAAKQMVSNDPQINPNNEENTEDYATPIARIQYGSPYMDSTVLCPSLNDLCYYWGSDTTLPSTGLLLTGSEYQDGIADYNAVMSSTVNLMNDAQDSETANEQRKFISKANEQGWITAGSYFFDLVQLNGNAAENQSETDTNTGLEKSEFSTTSLTQPFGEGSCTGQYAVLCEFFNKDVSKTEAIVTLINGSPLISALSQPDVQNAQMSNMKPIQGTGSTTAYGYVNNGYMIDLPDQAGLKSPTIAPAPPPPTITSSYTMGKSSYSENCQLYGLICFGKYFEQMMNEVMRPLVNGFLSFTIMIANKTIYYVLYVPVMALASIFTQGLSVIGQEGVNPIVALGMMGIQYINFIMNFYIVFTLFAIPASFSVTFWVLLTLSFPLLAAWFSVMLGIGFLTAYYIPFLPYMLFTFGAIGWFMAVIEAMAAAPIIALGISNPEGHDALGKGEQGFMILLNVFLRPGLMIIGYLIAISLSYVAVWLINAGFQNVIDFLQSDSFWGKSMSTGSSGIWAQLFGYFFGSFTYTILYMMVVQKAFGLIASLPDEILTYIGGTASQKGRESQQWAEDIKQKMTDMGQKMESGGLGTARKIGGAAGTIAGATSKPEGAEDEELQAGPQKKPTGNTPPTPPPGAA